MHAACVPAQPQSRGPGIQVPSLNTLNTMPNCCLQQGLLDTDGCSACQVLNEAGLSADKAEAAFVDPQMVPTHKVMTAGDLHWAPDARKALQVAAELCTYTGGCKWTCSCV